jgi:hypothetical protein
MRVILAVAAVLFAVPGLAAEAVTFTGTLGGKDIVVELTDLDGEVVAGRFSYLERGADIPLLGSGNASTISLLEEAECTEETCQVDADGNIAEVPVAAQWMLSLSPDGRSLSGSWTAEDKPGKSLDITLAEIGRRPLSNDTEITPMGVRDSTFEHRYGGPIGLTPEDLPYDWAKMDIALEEEGPVQTLDGSSYRFLVDPRTRFAFPRLVALADGSSPDAANAALAQRHAAINANAFDCLSAGYAGFASSGYSVSTEGAGLGDFDGENVEVVYLSPTVLNWTEGGSTWCGGAHPNNHYDSYMVDVRTGAPLPLAKVFKDWIFTSNIDDYDREVDQAEAREAPEKYFWSAGQPLIDYVLANRTPDADLDFEAECGTDELITTNLGVRFAPGPQVVFALQGLPHVNFACTADLLTVDLAQIWDLLAPEAVEYFPSLRQ